jgi:hypothetical protein
LHAKPPGVHGEDVKNGDDLHVSLNDLAMDVLRRQQGKHPERVFTYKGKPINWANTRGWCSALVRAGIANFRWHDLRHTWASWLIQHGTPIVRPAGNGRLEVGGDGAALRAPGARQDGPKCCCNRCPVARDNYVTVRF